MSERRTTCAWDPRYERVETVSDDGDVIGTRFEPVAAAAPLPDVRRAIEELPQPATLGRVFVLTTIVLGVLAVVATVFAAAM